MTKEKYIATLIGCAIGDTLGMPVEGWKKEQIKKYIGRIENPIAPFFVKDEQGNILDKDEFGRIRYLSKGLNLGDVTDDTCLTLVLAKSISETKYLDLNNIAKKQIEAYDEWFLNYGDGGFGQTTRDAFKNLKEGINPLNSGVVGGPGNGPAMKMSPIGLYIDATDMIDEGISSAEKIGKITHLDPRSIVSGIVQATAVYILLRNVSKDSFIPMLIDVCRKNEKAISNEFRKFEEGSFLSKLQWILENKDVSCEVAHEFLGSSSFCFSSHAFTLFMFQKYWDDPINGLIETINYGGDCDTTGAMFGVLAGAKNGMIFPKKWTEKIKDIDIISTYAENIYSLKSIEKENERIKKEISRR